MSIHPDPLKKILGSETVSGENLEKNIFFKISAAETECQSMLTSSEVTVASARICYRLNCANPTDHLDVTFNFSDKLDEKFIVLGKFKSQLSENIFKLDRKNNSTSVSSGVTDFLNLGMNHIGATSAAWTGEDGQFKIADGIDHILFVVALLLISSGWRGLLINISGFTLGHSVSLALALSGVLVLPAAMIEPAIALTIAYVAWRGIQRKKDESLMVTMAFGFLHGMGFSYVLQGLHTSNTYDFCKTLLLFNLGIEAGQLLIVLLLSPLLIYLLRSGRFADRVVRSLSSLIFILAIYWAVQRMLPLFAS